jgi:hypothetical protein
MSRRPVTGRLAAMTKLNPLTRSVLAMAAAAALAPAAVAGAQDPGEPPSGDAAPLQATLSAPSTITKQQLQKGVAVTVTCDRACNARLLLAGRTGIVTQKSGAVPAGARTKIKLKAPIALLRPIKKGSRYTLSLQARSDDGGYGQAIRKVKIR